MSFIPGVGYNEGGDNENDEHYCDICNIGFSDEKEYNNHLKGRVHENKASALQITQSKKNEAEEKKLQALAFLEDAEKEFKSKSQNETTSAKPTDQPASQNTNHDASKNSQCETINSKPNDNSEDTLDFSNIEWHDEWTIEDEEDAKRRGESREEARSRRRREHRSRERARAERSRSPLSESRHDRFTSRDYDAASRDYEYDRARLKPPAPEFGHRSRGGPVYHRDYMDDRRDLGRDYRERPKEGPRDFREGHRDFRDGPRDYRDDPRDFREGPRDYRDGPRDFREGPRDYGPRDFRDSTRDYRDGPRDFREDPRDYRGPPRDLRGPPRDFREDSRERREVTRHHRDYREVPRDLRDQRDYYEYRDRYEADRGFRDPRARDPHIIEPRGRGSYGSDPYARDSRDAYAGDPYSRRYPDDRHLADYPRDEHPRRLTPERRDFRDFGPPGRRVERNQFRDRHHSQEYNNRGAVSDPLQRSVSSGSVRSTTGDPATTNGVSLPEVKVFTYDHAEAKDSVESKDKAKEEESKDKAKMEDIKKNAKEEEKAKKRLNPFYCEICDTTMTGQDVYDAHIAGKKHAKKEKLFRFQRLNVKDSEEKGEDEEKEETPDLWLQPRGQEVLEKHGEPMLGLQYVTEFLSSKQLPVYVCNLCEIKCDIASLIAHLISTKHRIEYMRENFMNYHIQYMHAVKTGMAHKRDKSDIVAAFAKAIQEEVGYEKIKVRVEEKNEETSELQQLDGLKKQLDLNQQLTQAPCDSIRFTMAEALGELPEAERLMNKYDFSADDDDTDAGPPGSQFRFGERRPDPEREKPEPSGLASLGIGGARNPTELADMIKKLASHLINNEEEAALALQVSNKLTQSLLMFRLGSTRLALLAHLQKADEAFDPARQEYFFDRHSKPFESILHFYRTGELHVDQSICGNVMRCELDFWGLEESEIEPCCWAIYSKNTEHKQTLAELDENFAYGSQNAWLEEDTTLPTWQKRMWTFLEEPGSSRWAKVYIAQCFLCCLQVYAILSMFFVALSIILFVLETHKVFQVDKLTGLSMAEAEPDDPPTPTGSLMGCCCDTDYNRTRTQPEAHPAIEYLDYVCIIFFIVELCLRFGVCPNKKKFWRSALNVIDLVCIIPYLVSIIMRKVEVSEDGDIARLLKIVVMLRIVRILRIFKLMKHYSAFKILVYTLKVSTKELFLMVVFLMSGVLMFASIIHYIERDNFPNIPIGIWWALVTMTTVGYGDKYTVSMGGYVVGSVCVICGVLVIAFTVPIVVNNFSLYYSHAQTRIKAPSKKKRRDKTKLTLKDLIAQKQKQIKAQKQDITGNKTISGDAHAQKFEPLPSGSLTSRETSGVTTDDEKQMLAPSGGRSVGNGLNGSTQAKYKHLLGNAKQHFFKRTATPLSSASTVGTESGAGSVGTAGSGPGSVGTTTSGTPVTARQIMVEDLELEDSDSAPTSQPTTARRDIKYTRQTREILRDLAASGQREESERVRQEQLICARREKRRARHTNSRVDALAPGGHTLPDTARTIPDTARTIPGTARTIPEIPRLPLETARTEAGSKAGLETSRSSSGNRYWGIRGVNQLSN